MKEMKYSNKYQRELLERGVYEGYEYFVISFGTHPCGYVKLNGNRNDFDVSCHGGITYREGYLKLSDNETLKGNFIGWDYAHFGDYMGYDEEWCGGVRYTTEEIVNECKYVIRQLKEIDNE